MSTLTLAGFSTDIAALAPPQRTAMVVIDDANLYRLVLEDFSSSTSLCYTHVPVDSIREDDKEETLNVCTVGPGIHPHASKPISLVYEPVRTANSLISGAQVHKFVYRMALIGASMDEVKEYIAQLRREKPTMLKRYMWSSDQWTHDTLKTRAASTLYLGKTWTELKVDIDEFLMPTTEQFYTDHGIPYNRTYLFHGVPGAGKSSCIRVLASTCSLPVYVLNLGAGNIDDSTLVEMIRLVEKRSIVAIEDIDRIFDNHCSNVSASSVSFATLLNVLDGTMASEGLVFILTCNNMSSLDQALRRSGRVDVPIEFKAANATVAEQMFLGFYPGALQEAKQFAKSVKSAVAAPSPASIQELLVKGRKRPASEMASSGSQLVAEPTTHDLYQ